jgi:addiction module RelE/StbE family toxin
MRTDFHKQFLKQYAKLPKAQKNRFEKVIIIFRHNPADPVLYSHALTGEWAGYYSIAFGGDWRAHYKIVDENTTYFVACGTHAQLYK